MKTVDTMDILLRIENRLGKHEAMLEAIQEDTKDTRAEAKYTNGKVRKLTSEMEGVQRDIKALYQAVGSVPMTNKLTEEKSALFKWTWEKIIFVFGAIATIIAFVIEKLRV